MNPGHPFRHRGRPVGLQGQDAHRQSRPLARERYTWRWNAKTFGENSSTLTALKKAHEQWDLTVTDCSMKDITNFTTHIRRDDHTARRGQGRRQHHRQGRPVQGPCGSSAIACTWIWWVNDAYTETDTRFATRVKWSNKGSAGAYDYQGIGAHEFGHSIGLSDLDDSSKLTMHFQGTLGYTGQRTLGRGDILGARALYGG